MATIEPITGFRQYSRSEANAVIDAKNAKLSEKIERELRDMQEKIHDTVRETVRDHLDMLSKRVEQNANDIREMYKTSRDEEWKKKMESLIKHNTENIGIIDSNVKELSRTIQ